MTRASGLKMYCLLQQEYKQVGAFEFHLCLALSANQTFIPTRDPWHMRVSIIETCARSSVDARNHSDAQKIRTNSAASAQTMAVNFQKAFNWIFVAIQSSLSLTGNF